jgi:hypothetical protein
MRQTLAIAAVLLGVGGASGYLIAPRATETPSGSRSDAALARPAAAAPRGLTEADVRRVIRDELSALPAPSAPAAASGEGRPGDAAAPAAILSPAEANALQAAHERIDRALAAREWTQGDAAVLAAALDVLPTTQRAELLQTLVPALNRGEVRLAYRGALFE